ncbi:MAG: SLC45 family MFS transporter [Lentisphaerae bacterium]|nr:SLC45 family MFS transporter [Lentisphaerota bacterium]
MNNSNNIKTYKCGTLRYTVIQVWSVMFWMLWGAVAMSMLGTTFNSATPFLFRNHGLSDTFLAVIMGTVFAWINTVMNPVLSTVSDNCRSKYGRRIPFILYTALPTAICMAAMPFYPYLCNYLPPALLGISTKALLLGFGAVIYHIFYLFIAILYYYLIPDVIPADLMGRYYGFFRVTGVVFGIGFSKFVFPYVASHPQIIYPAGAVFYLIAALALCFFVREGEYPPVPEKDDTQPLLKRMASTVAVYCRECFSKKYYWWYYIAGLVVGLSGCINMFMNFFYLDSCRMDMTKIGELGVYIGIITAVVCLAAGFVVDKLGAFQSALIAQFMMAVIYLASGILIKDFTSAVFWRGLLAVFSGLNAVAAGRVLVEVLPRSKFGMMASGRNLLTALFVGLINFPVGLFSDFLKNATPETTLICCGIDLMPMLKGYRFINFWAGICTLAGGLILFYFYMVHHRKRTEKAYEL